MSDATDSAEAKRLRRDLARSVLQIAALAALVFASLWILRPFLLSGLWAVTIAIATWPLLVRVQGWLGGRRALAVTALTVLLLLALLVPVYFGVTAVVDNVGEIETFAQSLASRHVPEPPDWVERVPLVGPKATAEWRALAAETPEELAARVTPYAREVGRWVLTEIGGVGALFLYFLLTVVITAILYSRGESAASGAERFARKLAGEQGVKAARLAAQAVRGVALGVVVTAVVQSALVSLGFVVIGVPFAAVLTAVCFVLAIAQIGPIPILIGVIVWAFRSQSTAWAIAFLVWALMCSTIDNVLRPVLIRRGADLPLLLIFAGVIGGLVAFGVVGLFVGPVVLAVAYMLLADWMKDA